MWQIYLIERRIKEAHPLSWHGCDTEEHDKTYKREVGRTTLPLAHRAGTQSQSLVHVGTFSAQSYTWEGQALLLKEQAWPSFDWPQPKQHCSSFTLEFCVRFCFKKELNVFPMAGMLLCRDSLLFPCSPFLLFAPILLTILQQQVQYSTT